MNYVFHLLVVLCIYIALAQSLNLAVGYGGLLSLSHAAFYGIGAYLSALLMLAGWPFLGSMATAALAVGLLAWFVALPAARLRDDFFVLVTLGLQMIAFAILYNWEDVTRGPHGLSVPRPSPFGPDLAKLPTFVLVAGIGASLCVAFVWWLTNSPYGRMLQATRDDEIAATSLGKDVLAVKRSAFAWSAGTAAIPGAIFASYAGYIHPTSFGLSESIFILCLVVIGGAGNIRGPVVGAIVLVLLPEVLRFLRIPDAVAANVRQILYGLAIIAMMRLRPQGIAGKYAFDQ